MKNNYYCYIYLDPRKPGHFCYSSVSFLYKPFYVGKGHKRRYFDHLKYKGKFSSTKFKNKLLKILSEGFTKQDIEDHILVISCSSEQEAFNLEVKLIKEIGMKNLCNLTEGGEGCSGYKWSYEQKKKKIGKKLSEETRKKLSILRSNENNPMFGKKHSDKTKNKMSQNHKDNSGSNHGMFGKHISDNMKQKLSDLRSNISHSKETKKKISESMINKNTGEKAPMAKLTKREVIQIKMLMKLGFDNICINKYFQKVSKNTISSIRCGNTWSSVTL